MIPGVYIDMTHDSSLTTVALLSAFLENNQDYLELLSPFVLYCLPTQVGAKIDCAEIKSRLSSEFGITDMPEAVIRTILKRRSQQSETPVVSLRSRCFYVRRVYDNQMFSERRQLIHLQMDHVAAKLGEFMQESPWGTIKRSPKELLLSFFETYGLTTACNADELNAVSPVDDGDLYIAARFVLEAFESDPVLFESLLELTRGYLTYRAIYQISDGEKKNSESKLKNVHCFLDCSLVVSLLGYDTPSSQKSAETLVNLIRKSGGVVYVFSHTVEEIQRLLMTYANSPHKLDFKLPGLKGKGYTAVNITALALHVSKALEKRGVQIHSIGDEALERNKSVLSDVASYLRSCSVTESRAQYDIRSIAGIYEARKHEHPVQIELCRAVLITQDRRLAFGIRRLTVSNTKEVSLAKMDTDMIAMLWIRDFKANPDVPKEVLLSNAAATTMLSDKVRKRADELMAQWVKDGTMHEAMAGLLYSDRVNEGLLARITWNNPEALTYGVLEDTTMDMLEPRIEAREQELETAHAHEMQTQRARYEDLVNQAKRLAAEETQRSVEKNREAEEAATRAKRARYINHKAETQAHHLRMAVKYGVGTILIITAVVLSVVQAIDIMQSVNIGAVPWWRWFVQGLLVLVALEGIVTFFSDQWSLLQKVLDAVERKAQCYFYERAKKQMEEYESNIGL